MAATSFARPQPIPQSTEATVATPSPFPCPQKSSTATIAGLPTTATRLTFADKILITLIQSTAAPTHWLHVPLLSESPLTDTSTHLTPSLPSEEGAVDASLLPFPHLTATTVLGGTREADSLLGQTLAVTVASAVLVQQGQGESRMVVFGLGLDKSLVAGGQLGRAEFEALVGLCLDVL